MIGADGAPFPDAPTIAPPLPPPIPPVPRETKGQQVLRLVATGLAAAMARTAGGRAAATGLMSGVSQGLDASLARQQAERAQAIADGERRYQQERQIAEDQRRLQTDQRQRELQLAQMISTARESARRLQTRQEHDAFVTFADGQMARAFGVEPGTLARQVPFVPVPVRQRAADALTRLDAAAKSHGITLSQVGGTQFDIDDDGQPETISLPKLQELAGVSMLDANGQPLRVASPTVQTFGQLFTAARNTPFADKPLPMRGNQIDYGEASLVLQRMGLANSSDDRSAARAETQRALRDDLRGAVLRGASDAEINGMRSSLRRAGLNADVELANIRKELLGVGQGLQTPDERSTVYGGGQYPTPDALITRGREALTGRAGSPSRQEVATAKAAARASLEAARKAAGDLRPVTDADVEAVLQKPGNLEKLRGGASSPSPASSPSSGGMLAPGAYRYEPGRGFVPVGAVR